MGPEQIIERLLPTEDVQEILDRLGVMLGATCNADLCRRVAALIGAHPKAVQHWRMGSRIPSITSLQSLRMLELLLRCKAPRIVKKTERRRPVNQLVV